MNEVIMDSQTQLMWQLHGVFLMGSEKSAPRWGAQDAAAAFCDNLNHAGYTDWRLPTIFELATTADYGNLHGAHDGVFFTQPPAIKSSSYGMFYWSSTPFGEFGAHVLWYNGGIGWSSDDQSMTYSAARCVRTVSTVVAPGERFVLGATKTSVRDTWTELEWSANVDAPNSKGWKAADDRCKALELAGKGDWRLPTIRELVGIQTLSHNGSYEGLQDWQKTTLDCWTATPVASKVDRWWVAGEGRLDWGNNSAKYGVRCVRDASN